MGLGRILGQTEGDSQKTQTCVFLQYGSTVDQKIIRNVNMFYFTEMHAVLAILCDQCHLEKFDPNKINIQTTATIDHIRRCRHQHSAQCNQTE